MLSKGLSITLGLVLFLAVMLPNCLPYQSVHPGPPIVKMKLVPVEEPCSQCKEPFYICPQYWQCACPEDMVRTSVHNCAPPEKEEDTDAPQDDFTDPDPVPWPSLR